LVTVALSPWLRQKHDAAAQQRCQESAFRLTRLVAAQLVRCERTLASIANWIFIYGSSSTFIALYQSILLLPLIMAFMAIRSLWMRALLP
jgi:hypothetical protein